MSYLILLGHHFALRACWKKETADHFQESFRNPIARNRTWPRASSIVDFAFSVDKPYPDSTLVMQFAWIDTLCFVDLILCLRF